MKGGMTKTLLVVDDETAIREGLKDLLEDEGFRVVSASNGQEALVLLRSEKPSCIILDLMMPVMTGGEFLDALRDDSEFCNTPVLILSAWAPAATARMAHIEVLSKPIKPTELLESVRHYAA
jgi:CheY-like chemotaxis protein